MAADLRLVVDAAQGDAGQLPVEGPGHAHGDGGLAHAGRAHQAEDLPPQLGGELLDGQELQDALLHLVQAEVVGVQHLPRGRHVHPLLRLLPPGQLQHRVQIAPDDAGLGGAEGLLLQAAHLFVQLFRHLPGQLCPGDALAVLGQLVVSAGAVLPQLLLDHLHLLPQDIVPLAAGELLPHLALELLFHLQDLHLPAEALAQALQPAHRPQLLQDGLLVAGAHGQVLGDVVGDVAGILAGQHRQKDVGGHLGGQLDEGLKELIGLADQRLRPGGAAHRLLGGELLHPGGQIGLSLGHLQQAAPAQAFHHHPHIVAGQAEELAHIADGADTVKVFLLRILHGQIPLGHQENGLAGAHGLVQGLDGGRPAHVKVEQHVGEDRQPPQRQGGHGLLQIGFHGVSLPSGVETKAGRGHRPRPAGCV